MNTEDTASSRQGEENAADIQAAITWIMSFDGKYKSKDQGENTKSVVTNFLNKVSIQEVISKDNVDIVRKRYINPMLELKQEKRLKARSIKTYLSVLKSDLFPYLKHHQPSHQAQILKLEWQITRWHNNLNKEATTEKIVKRVEDMCKYLYPNIILMYFSCIYFCLAFYNFLII